MRWVLHLYKTNMINLIRRFLRIFVSSSPSNCWFLFQQIPLGVLLPTHHGGPQKGGRSSSPDDGAAKRVGHRNVTWIF